MFVSQMLEDREELRRRNAVSYRDDEDQVSLRCLCVKLRIEADLNALLSCCCSQGVLSDSENEEPIGWRIRNMSAFVRRSKPSATFSR